MLTYNRLLSMYLQEALDAIGLGEYGAQTYHSWLMSFFANKVRKTLPTKPGSNFDYRWDLIESWTAGIGKVIDHLIIDETQDFPIPLLKLLARISRSVSVFADPEQAIFLNTQAEDLTAIFDVPNPYMLTKNFRNPISIERASRCFAPDNGAAYPDGASREGPLPTIWRFQNYRAINKWILDYAYESQGETIGVILSSKAINASVNGLQNDLGISVEYFKSMSNTDINITSPGIKVLSFGVMKGLEFDTVIIPDTDRVFKRTEDEQKDFRRMYVAMSRASERLYLLHQGRGSSMQRKAPNSYYRSWHTPNSILAARWAGPSGSWWLPSPLHYPL